MRARRAALDALAAVRERDAYANLVLPRLLRSRGLAGPEAGRATDLTYGTLRGLGTYDRIIDACSQRPLPRIDPPVLDALRLGTYQLLEARVPPHAAVSTTVELVRQRSGPGAARFANAVLRHVADADLDEWAQRLTAPDDQDPRARLAFRLLHPRWVVDALGAALGDDDARLGAVLAANNRPPRVTLTAVPGRLDAAELAAQAGEPGRWADTAVVLGGGDPRAIDAVRRGLARVQDEGSQVVTSALATADLDPNVPARWLDMCAGPGGKAVLLAALAEPQGVRLLAGDIHHHRAGLVRKALTEVGLTETAGVVQSDGTARPWPDRAFGRVLLDAPCTGLGALRRRPEARWRRRPSDLDRLVPLQRRLLHQAIDSTHVGGVVGYVTCSPHPQETEQVVRVVGAARRDVRIEDAAALRPDLPQAARGPFLQLWPDLHGTDAMFLALLRRVG